MTPLKNAATIFFFSAIACFAIVVFCVFTAFKLSSPIIYALLAFMWVIIGLHNIVIGVNLNRADKVLGETFIKCPFCFSTNIVFDVKFYTFDDAVLCRDCQARWKFHYHMLTSSLTRLYLTEWGTALREDEKSAVPRTDDPEQWRAWAKRRFLQGQRPSPAPSASQGQVLFCRFCGHLNLPDANFCSACGRKLQT